MAQNRYQGRRPFRTFDRTRINDRIRVSEVRCVDDEGNQVGVIDTKKAITMAKERGLDLVEVSPTAKPPVCRIMDYGKYKYEQGKKEKVAKKHQGGAGRVKEIKFHANVGDHDYDTKVRHLRDFLTAGHKTKVSLFFRGRENAHRELGFELMQKVIKDCEDLCDVEQRPQLIGRNLIMRLSPKSAKSKKS